MADRVPGRVILVGGGPGADDLITVRGLDRLMAADVVVADRLAPVTLLSRLGQPARPAGGARSACRPAAEVAAAGLANPATVIIEAGMRAGLGQHVPSCRNPDQSAGTT